MKSSPSDIDPYTAPLAPTGEEAASAGRGWRRYLGAAWIATTLAVMALAIYLSLDPDNYFFYSDDDRAAWKFNPAPVIVTCAFMALEGFLLHRVWFGRLWSRAWLRAAAALVFFVPWMGLSTMMVMHSPRFIHLHIVWVWFLTAGLALTFVWGAGAAIVRRIDAGSSTR